MAGSDRMHIIPYAYPVARIGSTCAVGFSVVGRYGELSRLYGNSVGKEDGLKEQSAQTSAPRHGSRSERVARVKPD